MGENGDKRANADAAARKPGVDEAVKPADAAPDTTDAKPGRADKDAGADVGRAGEADGAKPGRAEADAGPEPRKREPRAAELAHSAPRKPAPEPAPEDTGKNTAQHTPEDPPTHSAKDAAKGAPKHTPKDATTKDAPKDAAKGAPKDAATKVAPKDAATKVESGAGETDRGEQAAPAASPGRETGRLLAGRYRLGGIQGRGGMGTVWRARDEVLGRTVAVKELRFPSDIDEDEKRRLITRTLREAKAIARIRSGSAVTVFDVVDEDDRPWIVMELVEGRSLADVIREDGPVTSRRAAEIGLAVLGVLRAAHREGIVHRDVKPSNVLIEEDTGRVVLTDFGIAKVEGDPSVTSTGMLVGAPSYISPERARGQLPGPPADMWSLGGLLYAAVEGSPPYDKGSALATLTAVMTDALEPPKNAGLLEEVIYGLLHKDPVKRLDDAGARVLLQSVLDAPDEPKPGATATVAIPATASGQGGTGTPAARPARTDPGAAKTAQPQPGPKPGSQPQRQRVAAAFASAGAVFGGSGDGDGAAKKRANALVIAAVLVVLIGVLGAVLAFTLNGGTEENTGDGDPAPASGDTGEPGGDAGESGAQGGEQTSGGADGAADGSEDEPGDGQNGGTDEGAGDDKGGTGADSGQKESGDGLPEGYATVTDQKYKFSIALPEGWTRVREAGRDSGGVYAAERGAVPSVQVDYTGSPGQSALNAWESLESAIRGTFTGYDLIGMDTVEWRDYPTVADWTYEHTRDGERLRSLNRGFRVDSGRGHAILITCPADAWDGAECTTLRETAFETFQPID